MYDLYAKYAVSHQDAGFYYGSVGDFHFWEHGYQHTKFTEPHFFPSATEAMTWVWQTWGEDVTLKKTSSFMQQFELVKDWRP